ncbi:MAG: hypothetical protein A2W63_03435 [Deltaproteobacteria bacterium RIFCSPLOWO2_02_44_9]|nr:MAG: hypothetical protein A2W63_03435 [Deltaproteobacteria bacterium RIFCSPLOWO2_02_44_9]
MKRLKGLNEVHMIMEKIYDDERDLTPEQRIERIREEADRFLSERKLNLKKVKSKELKHVMG